MSRVCRLLVCFSLLLATVAASAAPRRTPAEAETARREMREAEQARAAQLATQREAASRASAAAAEQQRLARDRVAAAARLREAELATAVAADRMAALARRRQEAAAQLDARAADSAPLLPLMERLAEYPAETMLAVPASPDDALRGVLVLQGIAREVEAQAAAIRREQAEVDEAAAALHAEAPKLAAAEAAQASQASALDRQIAAAQASRRSAEGEATQAARQAQALAAQAGTLKGAITAIEAEQRAADARDRAEAARTERARREATRRGKQPTPQAVASSGAARMTAPARGALRLPAVGTLVRAFGAATDGGPSAGASYQTPPNARVVSPCGGRVVFAAPFRSYGRLLIVDCGGGMHVVLAGLERLDAGAGDPVQPGEPVGAMPNWQPGGGGSRPALYVELRKGGQPVNPGPWFGERGS